MTRKLSVLYFLYYYIDCRNQLVQVVEHNLHGSTPAIICIFLDSASQSEIINYTCSIIYGPCGKEANRAGSTVDSSNLVTLRLATGLSGCYMYTVTASNTTHVVMVEGSFDIGGFKACDCLFYNNIL